MYAAKDKTAWFQVGVLCVLVFLVFFSFGVHRPPLRLLALSCGVSCAIAHVRACCDQRGQMRERGEGGASAPVVLLPFSRFALLGHSLKIAKSRRERETQQLRVSPSVQLACHFYIPFSYLHYFALLVLYSFRFASISGSATLHAPLPCTLRPSPAAVSLCSQFELHMCGCSTRFSHAIAPSRSIFFLFLFRVPFCFVLCLSYPSHAPIAVRCWRRLGEREGGGGRGGDGQTRPHSIEPHFLSSIFSIYLPALLFFFFLSCLASACVGVRVCALFFFVVAVSSIRSGLIAWSFCYAAISTSVLSRYRSPPFTPLSRATHL